MDANLNTYKRHGNADGIRCLDVLLRGNPVQTHEANEMLTDVPGSSVGVKRTDRSLMKPGYLGMRGLNLVMPIPWWPNGERPNTFDKARGQVPGMPDAPVFFRSYLQSFYCCD